MADTDNIEIPKCWAPLYTWHFDHHYDKQKEFVRAVDKFWEIMFLAGNGTGKSHILYWSLICFALGIHPEQIAKPPIHIKVLLNDFEHGYGKIFTETCLYEQYLPDGTVIPPMLVEDPYMVTRWPSRDDKSILFYNKSIIFFQTSEQKKRQHSGANFDILACDEEPSESIYDESKRGLRTAKGGGRILHAMTPPFEEETKNKGPSWTKFKILDPFEKKTDNDLYVVRAAMYENPAVSDEFIKRFSKGKTEQQVRIQVYGDYPTWGDMIFPEFTDSLWNKKEKTGHILPYDFVVPWEDDDFIFEMALDWHGSKPPAVIWSFEVRNYYLCNGIELEKGDVVIFDEISPQEGKEGKFTISKTAEAIREHEAWRRRRIIRWGDPKMQDKRNDLVSGFSPWKEFRHCGIRLAEAWNREPYVGYSIIRDFLRGRSKDFPDHPRLFVKENCHSTIHNMKNHYNVPKGDGTAVPDPKFSDYCVNVKYIMQNKSRKIKKNMEAIGRHRKWPMQAFGKEYVRDDTVTRDLGRTRRYTRNSV